MSEKRSAFDPSRYLTKLGNADYLEVKFRLLWLREIHPDATIETSLHSHDERCAVFRAFVSIPGGGSATGWKQETPGDFRDYLEKAETGALGRALAALGFGTQFTYDVDGPIADSPVDRSRGQGATNAPRETIDPSTGEIIPNRGPAASEKQIKWIKGLGKGRGYVMVGDDGQEHTHEQQLTDAINREFGTTYASVDHLSKFDASRVIDKWAPPKEDRQQQAAPTPIRQSAPAQETVADELAWTDFWGWARTQGVNGAPKFTEITQRSIQGLTPPEARALLTDALASMPPSKQGTAGPERYTS